MPATSSACSSLVYVFNFLDRQILSILAERIKADLGLTRRADRLPLRHRVRGLLRASSAFRSGGSPTSGTARELIALGLAVVEPDDRAVGSRAQLRRARAGAHRRRHRRGERHARRPSRCCRTTFRPRGAPPCWRSTRAASTSAPASASVIGGLIVERWDARVRRRRRRSACAAGRSAFFAVGLARAAARRSGCATLREPVRGQQPTGVAERAAEPHPLRAFLLRAARRAAAVHAPPPGAHRRGPARARAQPRGGGRSSPRSRRCSSASLGTPAQWIALGIGVYAAFSWPQALALRDPAALRADPPHADAALAALGFACSPSSATASASGRRRSSCACTASSEAEAGLVLGGDRPRSAAGSA